MVNILNCFFLIISIVLVFLVLFKDNKNEMNKKYIDDDYKIIDYGNFCAVTKK